MSAMAAGVRLMFGWLAAVIVAAALGSVVQTQVNLGFLVRLDTPISWMQRFETSFHDLAHFAPLYAFPLAIAMLISLSVFALLGRLGPVSRGWLYAAAGAAAVWAMIAVMNRAFPMTPIAATRTGAGVLLMALGGAAGGWVFARLGLRRSKCDTDANNRQNPSGGTP